MAFRTGNPALKVDTFTGHSVSVTDMRQAMSLNGVVHRTAFLLFLVVAGAAVTWNFFFSGALSMVLPMMLGGTLSAFVLGLVLIFKPHLAPKLAWMYALLEGLALGGISAYAEMRFPGVVIQAVGVTFGTLFSLLAAYRSGLIKATENFKLGVVAATGGVCLAYLGSFILGMFGIHLVAATSPMGILLSVVVVIIAALNLVLDFDFIESGVEARAPKWMEWYAAFGLMVTLIWLYLEILRLLMNTQRRED